MSNKVFLVLFIFFLSACNETDTSPQSDQSFVVSNPALLLAQDAAGKLIWQESATALLPTEGPNSIWQLVLSPDASHLYIALRNLLSGQLPQIVYNNIVQQGCALYSVTLSARELRCAASGIFADVPDNTAYPALSFDSTGNLLVIGQGFTSQHSDTCLQPTSSGCAAWQVNYEIQAAEDYAQLYRIVQGETQQLTSDSTNMVLGAFAAQGGRLHILSGSFAGYELVTQLNRLTPDGANTPLGEVRNLLNTDNGLLFVDKNNALQFSQGDDISDLQLPSAVPGPDHWFNPEPQAMIFDQQGRLYALFQERRRTPGGEWQDYLLTYRLLPFASSPLTETPVSTDFFGKHLKHVPPTALANGFAAVDCAQDTCSLLTTHINTLEIQLLPADFSVSKLITSTEGIILNGHSSEGQLMQMRFSIDQTGKISETRRSLFPSDWQTLISMPLPTPAAPLADLSITAAAQNGHNLSLLFNQAPTCSPQQITLHGTYGTQVFAGAYLQQAASLHLLNAPVASAITLEFNCAGKELHLEQILTEDSLAI